jgi:nitroreductase
VPQHLIDQLLAAAMQASSAENLQPWHFLVVDDWATLVEIAQRIPPAATTAKAPLAIVVCDDLPEAYPGHGPLDCEAATQDLLLAAQALGLGAVRHEIYPNTIRMERLGQLFGLPQYVVVHGLVVLGYAAKHEQPETRFQPDRVHRNRW